MLEVPKQIPQRDVLGQKWRTPGLNRLALLEQVQVDIEDWIRGHAQKDKRLSISMENEDCSQSGCESAERVVGVTEASLEQRQRHRHPHQGQASVAYGTSSQGRQKEQLCENEWANGRYRRRKEVGWNCGEAQTATPCPAPRIASQ